MNLKKSICVLIALVFTASGFAENLVLENQTSYPKKVQNSKMVIQWANSAKELEEANQALVAGTKLDPRTMKTITQTGTIKVSIPKKAEYFRVLAWSKGDTAPDLHTNWVEIVPNKTYTLEDDHLVPSVLMAGMGC